MVDIYLDCDHFFLLPFKFKRVKRSLLIGLKLLILINYKYFLEIIFCWLIHTFVFLFFKSLNENFEFVINDSEIESASLKVFLRPIELNRYYDN